jgi:hypothetical protein
VAANAEEFLLKLNQDISGPATVAARALTQLEGQIRAEQGALAGLNGSLASARTKLTEMQAAGAAGKAAAIEKQILSIDSLDEKLTAARAKLESLGRGTPLKVMAPLLADVQKLTATLETAKAKLKELEAGGPKNAGAIAAQKQKIGDLEGKASGKGADIGKLQASLGKFREMSEESKKAGGSLKDLGEAAKGSDGMIGKLANGFEKLKAAGPAAVVVALAVALLAVAAAAIAGAVALTKFALASADASRSSRLLSNAAAGGSMVGAELEAVINDVANTTPLARDRIAEMARSMEVAKLRGRDMQVALQTAATAASAIGDSAASAFTSIAEKSQFARRFLLTKADLAGTGVEFAEVAASIAKTMGISVAAATTLIQRGGVSVSKGLEAMNDAVQKKFGKTVAAQMLSLNTQFSKMKEGLGRLFDGVDIEPFLRGLKLITGLFSEQTVTGAALKTLFSSMFSGLAAASEGIFPIISAFLRGMVIAALTSYIAFLRVRKAIADAFGGDSAGKIDWIMTAMTVGKYAVYGLGVALFALVGIFALLAAVFLPLMFVLSLPFILAAAVVYGLYKAITMIASAASAMFGAIVAALSAITGIDLAAVGTNLVKSLANAITAGASLVIAAVTNLGTSAMSALKGILGIASPSKVFTAYGKFTAEGFADGVEDGTPAANETVKQLGAGEPTTGGQKVAAQRGGDTFVFNYYGPLDAFDDFRRRVLDVFEQEVRSGPEPVT